MEMKICLNVVIQPKCALHGKVWTQLLELSGTAGSVDRCV